MNFLSRAALILDMLAKLAKISGQLVTLLLAVAVVMAFGIIFWKL